MSISPRDNQLPRSILDIDDEDITDNTGSSSPYNDEPVQDPTWIKQLQKSNFPSTSRFFDKISLPDLKSYTPTNDENKRISFNGNLSSISYNPFLYPQQDSGNAPIDFDNLPKKINIEPTAISNEIPCYELTQEQLKDPISFLKSVQDQGEKFGAIKVKLPDTEKESFHKNIQVNANLFWFQTNKLLNNPPDDELYLRLSFHKKLIEFRKGKDFKKFSTESDNKSEYTLNNLPMIENRPLDLYKLFQSIMLKGGFIQVINNRLWPQVGRELGYKGEIAKPLTDLLDSTYKLLLYPYELYLTEQNEERINNKKRNIQPIAANKRARSDNTIPPLIIGSAKDYRRSVNLKSAKGFLLNAPHLVEVKQPPTFTIQEIVTRNRRSQDLTYTSIRPQTEFDKCMMEISNYQDESKSKSSPSISSIYNLRQFMEKDLKFQDFLIQNSKLNFNRDTVKSDEFESLYWQYARGEVSHFLKNGLELEMGKDIPSRINGSAFVRMGDDLINYKIALNADKPNANSHQTSEMLKLALHPWNLNNLSHLPNSVLGALNDSNVNNQDLNETRINIGMTFSTENWTCEDHFTQLMNYQFFGACKKWYFIPESEFDKFEHLLSKINKDKNRANINNQGEIDIHRVLVLLTKKLASDEIDYDILHRTLDNIIPTKRDIRLDLKDDKLNKLLKKEEFQYNQEFMITPELLQQHEIKFTSTIQQPGEYIIKFPKTYSSTISYGFNFSEEANFATEHWLDYAVEGEEWLLKQKILPNLSIFKMIIDLAIAYDTGGHIMFNHEIFDRIALVYKDLYKFEIEQRNQIRDLKVKEVVIDDNLNSISDDTFENAYPTRIVVFDAHAQPIVLSMTSFLEKVKSLQNYNIEMQCVYSDEQLEKFHKILRDYSIDYQAWNAKYEEAVNKEYEVTLEAYGQLLKEGEKIYTALSTSSITKDRSDENVEIKKFYSQVENLREFVSKSNKFIEDCQSILAIKHQKKIRNASDINRKDTCPSFDDLMKLISKIPKVNFTSPEIKEILELKNEIVDFDKASRALLSKKNKSFSEITNLINFGEKFGIEIPSLNFLIRVKRRLEWIRFYNLIEKGVDPYADRNEVFTITDLAALYKSGIDILSSDDVEMMKRVEDILIASQKFDQQISGFLKYHYVTDLDLKLLNEIIERFNEEKLFISLENYTELSNLHDNLALINKFSDLDQSTYEGIKQLESLMTGSGLKFNNSAISNAVAETENWINSIWLQEFRRIIIISTLEKNTEVDKSAVNPDLLRKLEWLYNKVKYSFNDDDKCTESTSYLTRNKKTETAKYYCICREPESGTMVACDRCLEWYHVGCVNAVANSENYVCPICLADAKTNDRVSDRQIPYASLKQIYTTGLLLKAAPQKELKLMKDIIDIADKYCNRIQGNINNMSINSDLRYNLDYLKCIIRKFYGSGIYFGELWFMILNLISNMEEDLKEQHLRPRELIYEVQYQSQSKKPFVKEVKESDKGFKIIPKNGARTNVKTNGRNGSSASTRNKKKDKGAPRVAEKKKCNKTVSKDGTQEKLSGSNNQQLPETTKNFSGTTMKETIKSKTEAELGNEENKEQFVDKIDEISSVEEKSADIRGNKEVQTSVRESKNKKESHSTSECSSRPSISTEKELKQDKEVIEKSKNKGVHESVAESDHNIEEDGNVEEKLSDSNDKIEEEKEIEEPNSESSHTTEKINEVEERIWESNHTIIEDEDVEAAASETKDKIEEDQDAERSVSDSDHTIDKDIEKAGPNPDQNIEKEKDFAKPNSESDNIIIKDEDVEEISDSDDKIEDHNESSREVMEIKSKSIGPDNRDRKPITANETTINESSIMREIDQILDLDISREINELTDKPNEIKESTPDLQNVSKMLPSMVSVTTITSRNSST
ncbi:unnamed protein product [Candida verbasci]|uniref:Uncharacterized protein n=1 Tax=Candida verbasci TaxID=1227364 RepID=A0A9W4XL52_9ASCO|nr:unnamed protein product [Candida verbasci]